MGDFLDYDPNDEEEMDDDEELEDEDEEDDEDEDEEKQQSELEKRVQERKDLNKFKKIIKTAPYRFYPHLTKEEKNLVYRMKKKHPTEVVRLEQVMAQKKQAFWAKVKSTITPALPFLGYLMLGIFIIIIVVVIIGTLFPWLFPEDGTSDGAASPFGIKGDQFYGARAVYKDEELSRNSLIEQYVDIVETSVENLQAETFTEIVEVDGENKTYDVKLTINLTLPAEDFDYNNLNLSEFSSNYADLYNIVGDIAKLVYKGDNSAEAPADLIETLDGIKYFGFNAEMIGSSIDDDKEVDNNVIEIVYDALTESGVIVLHEKLQSATEYSTATNVTMENIDDNIRSELIEIINVPENKVRAEKLFIKDFILADAESYMEGIEKKNYVALIYMPKTNVNFDYVSYMITIDKTADFNIILTNNGNEISLTKGDGEYWGEDENPTELTYKFDSGENLNQTVNAFDAINVAELNKFSSASSLAKVIAEASDYNIYLEQITDENGENVLTYKKGSMYLQFETDAEFMFNDEMTYGE